MINEDDKSKVIEVASQYGVKRVLLFGSSIAPGKDAHDIDLAVEGIDPALFFKFYGDLIFALSKPVDLIDLAFDSRFTRMVLKEGIPIYG